MDEGLATADGAQLSLAPPDPADTQREFAQAMAASNPGDADAPPKRASRARSDDAGQPRTRKPRTTTKPADTRTAPVQLLSGSEIVTGVKGLCQVAAALPALASKRVKDPKLELALKADAITIASAADDIAQACADTAAADPKFAALMAKICQAGPYAALMTVAFGVGTQLARNHGVASMPGTIDPGDLVKMSEGSAPAVAAPETPHAAAAAA